MKESDIKLGEKYSNARRGAYRTVREVMSIQHNEVRFKTIEGALSYWEKKYPGHVGVCELKSFAKWAQEIAGFCKMS